MKFENYEIWTPQGAVRGTLEIKDGKIVGLIQIYSQAKIISSEIRFCRD